MKQNNIAGKIASWLSVLAVAASAVMGLMYLKLDERYVRITEHGNHHTSSELSVAREIKYLQDQLTTMKYDNNSALMEIRADIKTLLRRP